MSPGSPCSPYFVAGIIVGTKYDPHHQSVTCRGRYSLLANVHLEVGELDDDSVTSWLRAHAPTKSSSCQ